MNKKSTITEVAIALLIVVVVVLALTPYGLNIWELIKIGIGYGKIDESNLNKQDVVTSTNTTVQNYPTEGYIKDIKPSQNIVATFNDQFPDNCLESLEKYQIILYSNYNGIGTSEQPCDNFGQDSSPKIIDIVEFVCKKS